MLTTGLFTVGSQEMGTSLMATHWQVDKKCGLSRWWHIMWCWKGRMLASCMMGDRPSPAQSHRLRKMQLRPWGLWGPWSMEVTLLGSP